MKILCLGHHTQGLIAACMLAKSGMDVTAVAFDNDSSYVEFHDGFKTGPVTHIPFALPSYIVNELDLDSYGFSADKIHPVTNPFEKLPFYDGLKELVVMFQSLNDYRPPYNEKSWRDTWNTFEIGRILSGYGDDIQSLFAKSATLSLIDLLDATPLSDGDKGEIIALCCLGSKTDPAAVGSAAAILPAMIPFVENNAVLIRGSIHRLSSALRDAAMALGVTLITEQKISRILMGDNAIDTVILDDESELRADHYIVDFDPVTFFADYLSDFSLSPAFRNRVASDKNTKETIRVKMALSESLSIPNTIIAPSANYLTQARYDMKKEGGSQYPVLSIIDVTQESPNFAEDGVCVLDITAQYFEPGLEIENAEALKAAVIQALWGVDEIIHDKVIYVDVMAVNSQFGQPTFIGTMPLLQLFKVFSGYHALAYDMPIDNVIFAGYGGGTCAHYHTYNGGARVANLLQSL